MSAVEQIAVHMGAIALEIRKHQRPKVGFHLKGIGRALRDSLPYSLFLFWILFGIGFIIWQASTAFAFEREVFNSTVHENVNYLSERSNHEYHEARA